MEKLTLLAGVVILLSMHVHHSNACGGKKPPPQCSWQTCRTSYSGFQGQPQDGQCMTQINRVRHDYQTHHRNGGCPGSESCSGSDQRRTYCRCIKFEKVDQQWSEWFEEKDDTGKLCRKRVMNADIRKSVQAIYNQGSTCPEPVMPEFTMEKKCE